MPSSPISSVKSMVGVAGIALTCVVGVAGTLTCVVGVTMHGRFH